ncbi:MAG: YjjG family noncanonical pyrimidine nucleotidase [bacterium]|nr:YjjG family noncanonical pyrimidine nucleotidase [bacterium]
MKKHIFFDLDRTLWDFEKNSEQALRILYEDLSLGNHMRDFETFFKSYKKINANLWNSYGTGKITKDVLRIKRFEDTLKSFQVDAPEIAHKLADGYVAISPRQKNIFPNTLETLEALKQEGKELHIITNGFKEVQFIKLENCGLLNFFDVIICSEDVGKNKPAPEIFQHTMQLAKAKPEESVMIGDDLRVDVQGAERQGMTGVLFDPHRQYNERAHEWRIFDLSRLPEIVPFMK